MLTILAGLPRSIKQTLRREADVYPEDEEASLNDLTDEELAELVAAAIDAAIAMVQEKVNKMETCVRNNGLTATQRKNTEKHGIRWTVGNSHAVYDDETYYSVYNPFLIASTSLRYEHAIHENAHHVYHAENNGAVSTNHTEDYWDIYDAIDLNAKRFCRGGG